MKPLANFAAAAADFLFPPECLLCQRSLAVETAGSGQHAGSGDFCAVCLAELLADLPRCGRCGASCEQGLAMACATCRQNPPPWRAMVVLAGYGDLLRDAVLRAKRPWGEPVGMALGRRLGNEVRTELAATLPDLVVPVPMHWRRRALRGTSSAGVIAAAVARALRLPVRTSLWRIRATCMQNRLPAEERPANVRGAFRAVRGVRARRVLLVDDVVTTGATVTAGTQALLAAGAKDVYVATVAKAERSPLQADSLP